MSSSRGLPRVHLAGKMGVVFRSLFPFGDLLSGKKRQSHRHLWQRRRPADIGTPAAPFAGFLESLIARMGQPVVKPMLRSEPLAHLDYQIESKVKDERRRYWRTIQTISVEHVACSMAKTGRGVLCTLFARRPKPR